MSPRRFAVVLCALVLLTACSVPPYAVPPTPTAPLSTATPTERSTATATFTAAFAAAPAIASPTPPRTETPPPAVPTPAVLYDAVCGPDLAALPPLVASGASASDDSLQVEAMIEQASADPGAIAGLTRYAISVTIDVDNLTLHGTQVLTITNSENVALSELYFGLYPNAPYNGARLDVGAVLADGLPVTTTLEQSDTAMAVRLPSPLAPGGVVAVRMAFTTTVPGAYPDGYAPIVYIDKMLALASWYPILLVHDEDGWHTELGPEYGDQVFSRSSLYTVRVTAPDDMVIVASGVPFQSEPVQSGLRTRVYRAGPVRDFYMIASRNFCVTSRQVDGTTVNSYYLEGSEAVGRRAADAAAATLRALNERVGVYPFREFDVAQSPVRAGGVEYPGVVVIGNGFYGQRPGNELDFVVAHETAHQWWYSLVGNNVISEPWLDEALTNYSASLFWEATYGRGNAENLVRQYFLRPYQSAVSGGGDMAVNLPVSAYGTSQMYGAIVYDKGAMFFVTLRQAVGDEAFFRILRAYFAAYKYGVARGADFIRIASAIGGPAADEAYAAWITGPRP